MLTACVSSTVLSAVPPPPSDATAPSKPLPFLKDGQAQTVEDWSFTVIDLYGKCTTDKQELLNAWPK